jgi:hypothetical protein
LPIRKFGRRRSLISGRTFSVSKTAILQGWQIL